MLFVLEKDFVGYLVRHARLNVIVVVVMMVMMMRVVMGLYHAR